MSISVIIPTFKPQSYLWDCLHSVMNQTLDYSNYEIILILNGCCEPYKNEIETFLNTNKSDTNVVFFQTDKVGVSNARNIGLAHAQGEYIAFIDDDDYISPTYLEELITISTEKVVGLSYTEAFIDRQYEMIKNYYIQSQFQESRTGLEVSSVSRYLNGPCMKLIHHSIIDGNKFNSKLATEEDTLLMFEITKKIESFSFTSQSAVYYRRIRSNSSTFSIKSFHQAIDVWWTFNSALIHSYLRTPMNYSLLLLITRVLGSTKTLIRRCCGINC